MAIVLTNIKTKAAECTNWHTYKLCDICVSPSIFYGCELLFRDENADIIETVYTKLY